MPKTPRPVSFFWSCTPQLLKSHSCQRALTWRPSHLYASLIEFSDSSQLLSVVDVRILILSKRHFQLLQLFVAEGGAVTSSGWGGVCSAPSIESYSHRGLAQCPLPHRLSYICFQGREKKRGRGCVDPFFLFFCFLGKNFPGLISSLPQHDTRNAALTEKAAIHQWLSQKKEGLPDFLVPTGIRQPESQRALAGKHKLVRNRHQKLEDLSKIITTITSKGTHLLKMSRLGLLVSDDIIKQLDVEWQRQLLWLHEQTW